MSTVWSFRTRRFVVQLSIEQDYGYQYDGDDDDGEYVVFGSVVEVYLDDKLIGSDSLGGLIYTAGEESEFWTAHRDPDASNRNTLAMKARNTVICHYFPSMVAEAIAQARRYLAGVPRMRAA